MSVPVRNPVFRTAVVERVVPVARPQGWAALVAGLDAGVAGPAAEGWPEVLLSLEPPWRRVGRLTIADANGVDASPLVEHTVVLRDDVDTCVLVWSAVVEVPPDATQVQTAAVDAVVVRLDDAMQRWATSVAGAAALA